MKYNIRELLSTAKHRRLIMAGGALAACLVVGTLVYFGLRMIMPRNTVSQSHSTSNNKSTQSPKDQLVKQADALYKAGDDALKIGDTEKGIAELEKALKLYEQTGDVMKAEQTKDQIALAKYALEQEKQYESAEKQADKGKAVKTP